MIGCPLTLGYLPTDPGPDGELEIESDDLHSGTAGAEASGPLSSSAPIPH